MGEVAWSDGFWKDRFDMVIPNVIPAQYDYFMGFSEYNFRIVGDKADPKTVLEEHTGRMATITSGLRRRLLYIP